MPRVTIIHSTVEDALRDCPPELFDGAFCDPPYALQFMQSGWDKVLPPATTWELILNSCKPGANLLAFGGTRTYHRLFCHIEDGGWIIRDSIAAWLYGSGMAKSTHIGKSIDKKLGAKRKVIGRATHIHSRGSNTAFPKRPGEQSAEQSGRTTPQDQPMITAPATSDAIRFEGYGTGLSPSWEPVCVAMKPREVTFAENALEHGVAGLNIDGCRLRRAQDDVPGWHKSGADGEAGFQGSSTFRIHEMSPEEIQARCGDKGRWPPNVILTHHPECRCTGMKKIKVNWGKPTRGEGSFWGGGTGNPGDDTGQSVGYDGADGLEEVEAWDCHPACVVGQLDEQNGIRKSGVAVGGKGNASSIYGNDMNRSDDAEDAGYGDVGGVSRYFYQAKASKTERDGGLRGRWPCAVCGDLHSTTHEIEVNGKIKHKPCIRNSHPTLKPLDLNEWLAKLILPPKREEGAPGRRLLIPFAGSGSEVIAAIRAGWDEIVAIEMNDTPEYPWISIMELRVQHALNQFVPKLFG